MFTDAKRCLIPFIACLCCLFSCKKPVDSIKPVVNVVSPGEFASFSALDIISVKADISDETKLEFVSIRLVDEGLQPAMPTVTFNPEGKEYSLNYGYSLNDIHLETGTYFLRINASDGVNETKKYVQVQVTGTSLERKGVVIVSTPSGSMVDVSIMDNSYNVSPFIVMNTDYSSSCASSYYQYINVTPRSNGDMKSFRVNDKSVQWSVSTPANFEGMDFYDELSYVCFKSGEIKGYAENGAVSFSALSDGYHYPVKAFLHEGEVFVQEEEITGQGKKLTVYYFGSGADSKKGLDITFNVAAFASKDEDNVFLFANDATGQGKMYLLETTGASYGYWSPHAIPAGKIFDAIKISADNYLIAHENAIYRYQYSQNSLTVFASMPSVKSLTYDGLFNEVIAADGSQIKVFDYPSGVGGNAVVKATIPYPNVRDIHLLYNK